MGDHRGGVVCGFATWARKRYSDDDDAVGRVLPKVAARDGYLAVFTGVGDLLVGLASAVALVYVPGSWAVAAEGGEPVRADNRAARGCSMAT